MGMWAAMRASSEATCSASSRVGRSTMAWTAFTFGSTTSLTNGMPKAAVLPEPVRDWTIRSLPWRTSGMVAACTSMARWKPMASTALRTSCRSPRSAKSGPEALAGPTAASASKAGDAAVGSAAPSVALAPGAAAVDAGAGTAGEPGAPEELSGLVISFMDSLLISFSRGRGAGRGRQARSDSIEPLAQAIEAGRQLFSESLDLFGVLGLGVTKLIVKHLHLFPILLAAVKLEAAALAHGGPLPAPVTAGLGPALDLIAVVVPEQRVRVL